MENLDIGPFNPNPWLSTYKNNIEFGVGWELTRIILNLELVDLEFTLPY